ncbi:Histone H2B-alpha like protein [Argiope bruennichi]|uniref:Histone H2B-alpha like protein n=1 Tax=Argiope bruennichi TaxID=94029 RepID=A0A8T0E5Q7_ARGBR|nr:Histone H2B-alpha like protein [Argiope bruennichi]
MDSSQSKKSRKPRRNRSPNAFSYKRYIRKLQKGINDKISISTQAVEIIDALVKEMFEQIASESKKLMTEQGKRTFLVEEARCATKSILRGKLADGAIDFGNGTLRKYNTEIKKYA